MNLVKYWDKFHTEGLKLVFAVACVSLSSEMILNKANVLALTFCDFAQQKF